MALSRFDRRIRIVSFRLSDREYQALREFCEANGLRGISDLTRRAIRGWFLEARPYNSAKSAAEVPWSDSKRKKTISRTLDDSPKLSNQP